MTLWFVLSLMTVAAIFAVLWPLARRPNPLRSASDIAVYRDQLEEVRRDRTAGRIGENEASAAEREVSRRLIAAADASSADAGSFSSTATMRRSRLVAIAVLALLPIGAAGLYLALGSPTLPDQPLAPRLAASGAGPSVESLVTQVEAHLELRPDDGRGWEVIAPVYMRLGRFDDAVKARRSALRLNGETAEREAALGEALVFAANGVVTADAKAAFDRALALDAAHVQARYFVGLAAEQDGNPIRAAAIWRELLTGAPPDAPWTEFLQRALARVDASADRRPGGPSEDQIAASSELGADQRNAMIRGMVERLSQRLARDGSDPEGWLRLVRSYMVLGEPGKARAAATDARRALAGDPTKLRQFEDLVRELGLEG
jgi:cytochrome c-type biogenesis protein CcmH